MHASLDDYIVSPAEQRRRAIDLRRKFAPRKEKPVAAAVDAPKPIVRPRTYTRPWIDRWDDPQRPLVIYFGGEITPYVECPTEVMGIVIGASTADIIRFATQHFRYPSTLLCGASRNKELVRARHITAWLIKALTGRSYPEIGRRLGGRDHTTILHAVNRIERAIAEGDELGAEALAARGAFANWRKRR